MSPAGAEALSGVRHGPAGAKDAPIRLAVFADPGQVAPRVLLSALAGALERREDVRLVAVFLSRPVPSRLRRGLDRVLRRCQVLLGSGRWERALDAVPGDPVAAFVRERVPVRALPSGDPNHPSVIAALRIEFAASHALNLYCMRRFGAELLSCCGRVVNYHNGFLPAVRGLRASNWSVYLGHSQSGYAFHDMTAGLDEGDLLLGGGVDVVSGESPADLELRKAEEAAVRIPEVLDRLVAAEPGQAQSGPTRCYTRVDWLEITRVPDPEALTAAEWSRRLSAFLVVHAKLGGRWTPVTAVANDPGSGGPGFVTSDGTRMRVSSIAFWPCWLWPLLRLGYRSGK